MLDETPTPTPRGVAKPSGSKARLAVIVGCLLLLVGALFVGRATESNSVRARTDRIASDIKCPTCQGLSVQQSKAGTAKAIYSEIERQVVEGVLRFLFTDNFFEQPVHENAFVQLS